jgi:DNA-binding XRE family transcriptional regulator
MEHIEDVVQEIEKRIPGARTRVERAASPRGPVWVDVTNGTFGAAIEWRQGMGFGLTSLPSDSLGEASDETYDSVTELIDRVESLLNGGPRTRPPVEAVLRTLREHRRVSQEALARLLGVSQPNISRLERRVDMNIRTLRAVIEAIGGHLEIVARFGNDAVRITQFDESDPAKSAPQAPQDAVRR